MDISKMIKIECAKHDVNTAELARRCGWTSQNIHDRLKRNSWKADDLEKIAAALNCDLSIKFIDKETGKEF